MVCTLLLIFMIDALANDNRGIVLVIKSDIAVAEHYAEEVILCLGIHSLCIKRDVLSPVIKCDEQLAASLTEADMINSFGGVRVYPILE